MVNGTEVKTRPAKESDFNFIMSTWLKSYRDSDFAKSIPNDIYYNYHQALIYKILQKEDNSITVLCAPEDEDHILGYVVYNTKAPIIFFLYVKYTFRRIGLGKMLFNAVRDFYQKEVKIPETMPEKPEEVLHIQCTHKYKLWGVFASKYRLIYNPYIVGE